MKAAGNFENEVITIKYIVKRKMQAPEDVLSQRV